MTFLLGASLLISLAIGYLLTCIFLPFRKQGAGGFAMRLFAGAGLGIGVTSCLYFACLLPGLIPYVVAVDLVVCLVLGLIYFMLSRKRRLRKAALPAEAKLPAHRERLPGKEDTCARRGLRVALPVRTGSRLQLLIAVIFSLEIIASLVSFFVTFLKEPHGRWDAWLIWNMHARFLFRSGEEWRAVFASGLDWSHWDYPLLLPLAIVRSWGYMGGESGNVPAVFAFVFTFLVVGLLLSSLSLLRGRTEGIIAAMILMGTPFFITLGASQFADIPFAFFVLATLVMIFLQGRSPENHAGPTILAGLAAGLCAWTKNEGLLFVLIAAASVAGSAAVAGVWRQSVRRTGAFLTGALPVLLIVLYFKTRLSPANDLVAGFSWAAASAKILDPGRYVEIAKAFFFTGMSFTQGLIDIRVGMYFNPGAVNILLMAVYLLFAGIRIDERDRSCLFHAIAVLVLMLAGYFFVYVLTPLDLTYHLVTSLNRLFLQLWPSAVFLFFMAAGIPEQTSPAGSKHEAASLKVKRSPMKVKTDRKSKETK